jgi:hypothetical protein
MVVALSEQIETNRMSAVPRPSMMSTYRWLNDRQRAEQRRFALAHLADEKI